MAEIDCRANLITATTPLFAERGFNGVGVRELATAAGVNRSSDGKNALPSMVRNFPRKGECGLT